MPLALAPRRRNRGIATSCCVRAKPAIASRYFGARGAWGRAEQRVEREAVRELREWESEAGGQGGRAAAGCSLAFYIDTRTATGRCTYVAAQKRQPAESGWQSRQRRQRRQRRPRWQAEPAEPAGEPAKSVGAAAVSTGGAESEKPVSPGRLSAAGNWKPAGAPHAARAMSRPSDGCIF